MVAGAASFLPYEDVGAAGPSQGAALSSLVQMLESELLAGKDSASPQLLALDTFLSNERCYPPKRHSRGRRGTHHRENVGTYERVPSDTRTAIDTASFLPSLSSLTGYTCDPGNEAHKRKGDQ